MRKNTGSAKKNFMTGAFRATDPAGVQAISFSVFQIPYTLQLELSHQAFSCFSQGLFALYLFEREGKHGDR